MGWWYAKAEVFDAKPIRERLIVAALLLAVVWSAFNFTLLAPLEGEKSKLHERLEAAESEIKKLSTMEMVLTKALSNDPNAQKKKEIDRLEKHLDDLEENLQTLSVGLIPADELTLALHDVLHSLGSLKLVGMETLAPTQLRLHGNDDAVLEGGEGGEGSDGVDQNVELDESGKVIEQVGVFKHSVVVALEGKYFDVVSYLRALESLPWKIYWQGVDYEVLTYPKAKVLIEVYTLSTEEGVLGV